MARDTQRVVTTGRLAGMFLVAVTVGGGLAAPASAADFASNWPEHARRAWVGPEFWANRLQDWRIEAGRLVCTEARGGKPLRTVHLLTRRLGAHRGELSMSVKLGLVEAAAAIASDAGAGFLIGAGATLDYRAAALVHHSPGADGGLFAGIEADGTLIVKDLEQWTRDKPAKGRRRPHLRPKYLVRQSTGAKALPKTVRLELSAQADGDRYTLVVRARDAASGKEIGEARRHGVKADRLVGQLALVSHPGSRGKTATFWFEDWRVSGSKVEVHDDRTCGPILSAQHTLSRGTLKMTAQMMPLGETDTRAVSLEIQRDGQWKQIAVSKVTEPGYIATFKITDWDDTRDTPYRVVYLYKEAPQTLQRYLWSGTVRRDPVDTSVLTVAAFTGNHNMRHYGVESAPFPWNKDGCWFPHNELVRHVASHKPDLLFFSGDQVYESCSPTRAEVNLLDYLYKWYLWCWAFRDLTKDVPCIAIPDDHDVYQGNIWGAGGRKAKRQDDGGYTRPVEFVKQTERTQTSNLPDPFDPRPIEQGIGVYFCEMNVGRLSVAVIEDRKFKSSPTVMIPEGKCVNGWFQNPDFDPVKSADVPGAVLLGQRQLDFLNAWSKDWSHQACMKTVVSQTVFSNVATLPVDATSDKVVQKLEIFKPGEYPPNDRRVADADSNGWPQTGRNKALREFRRGFALHVAGDQHLGSTIQYGVEAWHDAGFAICVPSVANFFPRRWFPREGGRNREPGAPKYTGDFLDGFGNHMTVHAVSNPVESGHEPANLYDRAPGYGIVRFDCDTRMMSLACWPRWVDPTKPDAKPYPGWPVEITQADNYGRKAVAYLPTVKVTGLTKPVVQVINEAGGEVVYTIRIKGDSFRPKVFAKGTYTIKVGDPDLEKEKVVKQVQPLPAAKRATIEVAF